MGNRDIISKMLTAIALAPGTITVATNGLTIDTVIADGHAFLVGLSDVEVGESIEIKLQHGDESDLSDATDVGSADVLIPEIATNESGGVNTITVTDAEGDGVYRIGYVGSKRYVRVVVTPTGGDGVLAAATHVAQYLYQETNFPEG